MKSHKSHKTIKYVSKKNTYKKYTKSFIGGSGTTPTEPFFVLSDIDKQQFFTDTFAKIGTKSNVSVDEFNKSSIIINEKDFPANIILYAFVILYYIVEHKFKIDIDTKDKQKQTEFIKILKIFVDKIINDINTYNTHSDSVDSVLRFQTQLTLAGQTCILRFTEKLTKIYKTLAQYFSIYNSTIDINDYLFITCCKTKNLSKKIIINSTIESIEIRPFAHINPKIASGKRISFNNTKNVKNIEYISNMLAHNNINNTRNFRQLNPDEYNAELTATNTKLTQIKTEIKTINNKLTHKTKADTMQLSILKNWELAHKQYLEDLEDLKDLQEKI